MRVLYLVMSFFSCDYIKTEIDYLRYQQCFNLLTRVQYSHSTWFLDGRTSMLVDRDSTSFLATAEAPPIPMLLLSLCSRDHLKILQTLNRMYKI